jgi:hypothetical protein
VGNPDARSFYRKRFSISIKFSLISPIIIASGPVLFYFGVPLSTGGGEEPEKLTDEVLL